MTQHTVEIPETTVATLSGHRVAVGNIWTRDYEVPPGASRHGPAANLYVLRMGSLADDSQEVVVGEGSILSLGAERWQVTHCEPGRSNQGKICLARVLEAL